MNDDILSPLAKRLRDEAIDAAEALVRDCKRDFDGDADAKKEAHIDTRNLALLTILAPIYGRVAMRFARKYFEERIEQLGIATKLDSYDRRISRHQEHLQRLEGRVRALETKGNQ